MSGELIPTKEDSRIYIAACALHMRETMEDLVTDIDGVVRRGEIHFCDVNRMKAWLRRLGRAMDWLELWAKETDRGVLFNTKLNPEFFKLGPWGDEDELKQALDSTRAMFADILREVEIRLRESIDREAYSFQKQYTCRCGQVYNHDGPMCVRCEVSRSCGKEESNANNRQD